MRGLMLLGVNESGREILGRYWLDRADHADLRCLIETINISNLVRFLSAIESYRHTEYMADTGCIPSHYPDSVQRVGIGDHTPS